MVDAWVSTEKDKCSINNGNGSEEGQNINRPGSQLEHLDDEGRLDEVRRVLL